MRPCRSTFSSSKCCREGAGRGWGGTTEAALNLASPDAWLPSWLLSAGLFICTERPTGANLSECFESSPTGHREDGGQIPQPWQPSSTQSKLLLPHRQQNGEPQAPTGARKGLHEPRSRRGTRLETQMGSRQGPWRNQFPLHNHSNNHVILRATPTAASAHGALTLPSVERS